MSVPSEIASYFTPEETLLKNWSSKGWNIYATQFRVFLYKKGIFSKQVIEASYEHISSIEFQRKRPLGGLFCAITSFFGGFIFIYFDFEIRGYLPPFYFPLFLYLSLIFWIVGILSVVCFIFVAEEGFTFHIVGRSPITLPKELTEMVRFIREKRPQEVYMRKAVSQEPMQVKEIIEEAVMIPCEYCGDLMPQTSTFCPNCGAKRKT